MNKNILEETNQTSSLQSSIPNEQAETAKLETTQAETTKLETTQAETTQAETTQAETTQAETSQAETSQAETSQAETVKQKRLVKFYKKSFSQKAFYKKVLSKVYLASDKRFVESFFERYTKDVKGKEKVFYRFIENKLSNEDVLRLNSLARQIKRKHTRINFVPLLACVSVFALVFVFLLLFRNVISRNFIVKISEEAFGAKCDIGFIDFNVFDTHFKINDYQVANKDSPMKNLFEVKNIDIYFNLLELTRGKLVCENIYLDGISWNTERKTSGSLTKTEDDKTSQFIKTNPIMQKVVSELEAIKNGFSISNGFQALREMTDPKLILERELSSFQSPALKDDIVEYVSTFTDSWKEIVENAKKEVFDIVEEGKEIANTNFQNLSSVEKIQTIISTINRLKELSNTIVEKVRTVSQQVQTEVLKLKTLAQEIESSLNNDLQQVRRIANNVKELKEGGVAGFLSELFRNFYLETLGSYYPRFVELLAFASETQSTPSEHKTFSLKDKSVFFNRLEGQNFLFSVDSNPSVLLKNISLSASTNTNNIMIEGLVKNVTTDSDKLNKPIDFKISSKQNNFTQSLEGSLDLRSSSPTFVTVSGDFKGISLDLNPSIKFLPSLAGGLETTAHLDLQKNNNLKLTTEGFVTNCILQIESFEPEFVSNIYKQVLADITRLDLNTELTVIADSDFSLNISTSVDEQIYASVRKLISKELARIRERVIEEGKAFLQKIKDEYLPQVQYGNEIFNAIQLAFTDTNAFRKMLDEKKEQAEARLRLLAAEKISEGANKLTDTIIDKFPFFP